VIEEIFRKYLEITSLKDFNDVKNPSDKYLVNRVDSEDFQINKFFYKNIGKKYQWIDRLVWADQNWIDYVSDNKLSTYILKDKEEMAGYFELIFYQDTRETEIAYFGILEEYFNKKLGGFLLSEAIKISFSLGSSRVWVHTSSLDHKNALKNYIARGMKIFKSEILIRK
tara:strand:+ start:469 stop:975 length:507 start_codon:yes stop_codon:yes gene_type:complete